MPAGCDFICKNKKCEHFDTGFVFTAPWPMGDIDEIVNSPEIANTKELREEILKLKDSGREFACITFPNTSEIETECYRVNLWSPGANCLWQYEVQLDGNSVSSAIKEADLPKECPRSGSKMINYREALNDGINCPHCKKELKQFRWFTKED